MEKAEYKIVYFVCPHAFKTGLEKKMAENKYAPGYFLSYLYNMYILLSNKKRKKKEQEYDLRSKCLDISLTKSETGTEYKDGTKERHREG